MSFGRCLIDAHKKRAAASFNTDTSSLTDELTPKDAELTRVLTSVALGEIADND